MAKKNLIGTIIDGRYTVKRKLGHGGMATVYVAEQHGMGREVALKVLHADIASHKVSVKRFFREAHVLGRLKHSNTVTIFDAGQAYDGTLYIAMELLNGVTIGQLVRHFGSLPAERVVKIAVQICLSLAEAHEAGMVHRDLKSENVFVAREQGRRDFVRVLDFGLVKLLDDPGLSHLTKTGSTPGTPSYMSPEVGRGEPTTARTDLYSLGVMMFEMISGKLPYAGENAVKLMLQHVTHPVPPLRCPDGSEPPGGMEAIIRRLMSKEPMNRFPSAFDLIEALASLGLGGVRTSDETLPTGTPATGAPSAVDQTVNELPIFDVELFDS